MSIFDKIGEGVKSFTEKASDVVETSKISAKINAEKNVIGTLRARIGEIVFEQFKNGAVLEPEVVELCNNIKESENVITKLEEEINRIKNVENKPSQCKKCGATLKPNAKFCPECGQKVEANVLEKVEEAVSTKHCPSCNEVLPGDVTFCPECGYQFKE